ncbi:flippase-like domain-containing protein [Methanocaldococcus infernus]
MSNKHKVSKKTILLFFIGISIILVILYVIGIDKIINILLKANPLYILLALILQFLGLVILTLRCKYILKVANYNNVSFKTLFLITLIGQFVNNTTPSMRGGGEPVRMYYLHKLYNISGGESAFIVIVERFIDTLIFLIMSFTVILLLMLSGVHISILLTAWLFFLIFIGLIAYLILNRKLLTRIAIKIVSFSCRILRRDIDECRVLEEIEKFYRSLDHFKDKKKDKNLIIAIILTIFWYLVDVIKFYLFFLSLNCFTSIISVAIIYFVTFLSGIFSLTPAGVGSADLVIILSSTLFNIPPSVSAGVTILDRIISFLIPTILGYFSYLYLKKA